MLQQLITLPFIHPLIRLNCTGFFLQVSYHCLVRVQLVVVEHCQVVVGLGVFVSLCGYFQVEVGQHVPALGLVQGPGETCELAFGQHLVQVHFGQQHKVVPGVLLDVGYFQVRSHRFVVEGLEQTAFLHMKVTQKVGDKVFIQRLQLLI